ncbi:MAG TPA: V-type ATP synthase subunit I [Sedimentisphaerales bacterium]|jgi:V/A-type H+-transporting ATPase subunit I|nr:V-type ATP synthase subunit I [Sedimentisphaerales bacterium]HNU30401.1 V-type ATP synthase subunit I [Sedimentisphaerales bacterium]
MAITPMAKVMIVSHRSQVSDLLEVLQDAGVFQVLDADEATVSKETPGLAASRERPKDLEELVVRLERGTSFLKEHAAPRKGLASMLAPRPVVGRRSYDEVVSDREVLKIIDQTDKLQATMEKTRTEIDHTEGVLDLLGPWKTLQTPIEELTRLRHSVCWPGLVPQQHFAEFQAGLLEMGVAIQQVSTRGTKEACIVVALRDQAEQVQKRLRSYEFEVVNFEGMTGTVAVRVAECERQLLDLRERLEECRATAKTLAADLLKVEILYDHYRNILGREHARDNVPATEQTMILEGWCREQDYPQLEQLVARFNAATIARIEPAEGEEAPVEIQNRQSVRPFEVVTRLYGMPHHLSVDPTPYLAPFFAIFFGMCIADAGYGLLMLGILAFFIKKMQGDKRLLVMLALCAGATVVVGALTGGWFGDAIQKFVLRRDANLALAFDPFKAPLVFFGVALGLGYIQLVSGLIIGFAHNLRMRNYVAAAFDQLNWIVLLNSIVVFALGVTGVIPSAIGGVFGYAALVAAGTIFLFSHREGGIAARLGMGFYNVFSSIFYLGDVLSYLRLMALGMVGAGLAMAINVIAQVAGGIPWIGPIIAILIFVGGHVFNLILAILSAFVHTLRLQYVEFFPKFLASGGREFVPLAKDYRHIYIEKA